MAWIVGLTGGIGCGKSTVASYFTELNVPLIDADQVAREIFFTDSQFYSQITERFGNLILDANGKINRKLLRKIIFAHANDRIWLEKILHPLIIEIILKWIKKLDELVHGLSGVGKGYGVVVAPLLLESDLKNYVDRVLVIDVSKQCQVERVKQRDGVDESEINVILDRQLPREERLKMADDIILNDKSLVDLKMCVLDLHHFYLSACS